MPSKHPSNQTPKQPSIINIGLVGGGEVCAEILEKTTSVYEQEEMYAPILAVADPIPESPGRLLADELGLLTFNDCRQLYLFAQTFVIIFPPGDRACEITKLEWPQYDLAAWVGTKTRQFPSFRPRVYRSLSVEDTGFSSFGIYHAQDEICNFRLAQLSVGPYR